MSPSFGISILDDSLDKGLDIDFALEHNLKHVEINLSAMHSSLHKYNKTRISDLQDLTQKYGISFSFHPSSSLNLGHSFICFRQRHIHHIVKCIKIGAQLGITHITIHMGYFPGHTIMHYFRHEALNTVVKSLKELIKVCSNHRIVLAIENSAKRHNGSEIEMLGDNIDDFKAIFNQIDSPWLGFCLDIGHANMNEGPLKYIEHFKDKIRCIHFHDNNGQQDEHLEIGKGTVPWEETVKALKEANCKGPYISECFKSKSQEAFALFFKYWEPEPGDAT